VLPIGEDLFKRSIAEREKKPLRSPGGGATPRRTFSQRNNYQGRKNHFGKSYFPREILCGRLKKKGEGMFFIIIWEEPVRKRKMQDKDNVSKEKERRKRGSARATVKKSFSKALRYGIFRSVRGEGLGEKKIFAMRSENSGRGKIKQLGFEAEPESSMLHQRYR